MSQKNILITFEPLPEGGERVVISHTNVAGHELIGVAELVKQAGINTITRPKVVQETVPSASEGAHKMD